MMAMLAPVQGGAYARSVMRRRAALALVMFGPVSCAESHEPAALAELCGEAGPVRMLELAPDQAMSGRAFTVGDRVYFGVGRPKLNPDYYFIDFTDRALWSTGPCGESPRRIADDVTFAFESERWPGRLLGCQRLTGDVLLLDPEGGAPHVVFAGVDCGRYWTEHGLVSISKHDDTAASLLLHPYPEDPRDGGPEPIVLLSDVLLEDGLAYGVRATDEVVRALTPDGELLRVELADRSVAVEQTDVRDYAISEDGRYLLWRSLTVLGGTPEQPMGAVNLRDRSTDFSVSLGSSDSRVYSQALQWADRGVMVFERGAATQIYSLDDLNVTDVPAGLRLDHMGPMDDGRWLLEGEAGRPWLHILDLKDGSVDPLFARQGSIIEREAEGVLVLDATPCCAADGRDEGALWLVPYDGSQPRRMSTRATINAYRPDPTRLVTSLAIGDDNLGELALIDLTTGARSSIDDRVMLAFLAPRLDDDPTLITYSVMDGERSGVWRVRLPPAP